MLQRILEGKERFTVSKVRALMQATRPVLSMLVKVAVKPETPYELIDCMIDYTGFPIQEWVEIQKQRKVPPPSSTNQS